MTYARGITKDNPGLVAQTAMSHGNNNRGLQLVASTPLVIVLVFMTGCFGEEVPLMANAGLEIPEGKIEATELEALRGSGPAALKLFDYYDAVVLNKESSLYWATVAAENDYPGGMYAVGFELALRHDEKSRVRARYWLEKAAKNGEPLANSVLKELEQPQR